MRGAGALCIRVVVVAALASTLVVVAGCYSPGIDPCRLACSANHACPSGLACNSQNMCAETASATCSGSVDGGIDGPTDGIPPETTITAMPPSIDSSTMPAFTFSSNEPGSFECSLDGGAFAACTSPHTVTVAAGAHTFRVVAIDTAGNRDLSPATHSWTVDTSLPDTMITATPGVATQASSATFSFTSNDSAATFECALDTGAFAACTSPTSVSTPAEKSWTFQVRAKNQAGSLDPSPATFTWVTDRTAPVVTFSVVPPNPTSSQSAAFAFTANEAATFQCALDAGTPAACSSTASLVNLSGGSHTFTVTALDAAGNLSANTPYTWLVDLQAPSLSFVAPSPAQSGKSGPHPTFAWSSNDATATYACDVDGISVSGCTPGGTSLSLPHGGHTFKVTATDSVGNSSMISRMWMVDCEFTGGPGALGMLHFNEATGGQDLINATGGPNALLGTNNTVESVDPARVAPGRFGGGALQFSTADGDVVTPTPGAALPLTNAFTVELWVKPAAGGALPYSFFSTDDATIQLYQANNSSVVQIAGALKDSVGNNYNLTLPNTTQDVWHQVTLTFDGTNATIYLDGVKGNQFSIAPGMAVDLSHVHIGKNASTPLNAANGILDAVFWGSQGFTQADVTDRFCPL